MAPTTTVLVPESLPPDKNDPIDVILGAEQTVLTAGGRKERQPDATLTIAERMDWEDLGIGPLLGVIGLRDVYRFFRGIAFGGGYQKADAIYTATTQGIKPASELTASSDAALIASRNIEKPDTLKEVKKQALIRVKEDAGKRIAGLQEGIGFYQAFPPGTPHNVIVGNAQVEYRGYDGATFAGVMEGLKIAQSPLYRGMVAYAGASVDVALDRRIERILSDTDARAKRFGG
ncbi:MAG: hypothetical protein HY362_03840 [Candidatus Aenigmarchaeota archaeon]|nr:hypothetical protein [Candidatus Aenigmarchaeota archaeon]